MALLEKIKIIHDKYPHHDLNTILWLAAKQIGYKRYDAFNVSDGDLLRGLDMLMDKDLLEEAPASHSYYHGDLV